MAVGAGKVLGNLVPLPGPLSDFRLSFGLPFFDSMQLSKFSDYSLRVLVYVAVQAPEKVSIDQITGAYGISRNHLIKVVQRLSALGLLETRRGKGGGIRLGRPAGEIRVGSVVRMTESTVPLLECFDAERNTCRLTPACRLKAALREAEDAFFDALDRYTLADVVSNRDSIRRLLTAS